MKLQFRKQGILELHKEMTWKKRAVLIASALVGASLLVLLVIYLVGLNRYQSCFLNGTIIDEVDVSGMSISELE